MTYLIQHIPDFALVTYTAVLVALVARCAHLKQKNKDLKKRLAAVEAECADLKLRMKFPEASRPQE